MYGLGADNAKAKIDNVFVQRIPPKITLTASDAFSGTSSTLLTPYGAGWALQTGRFVGAPAAGAPFALASNDISVRASSMLQLDTTLATSGVGGIVFDMYSPTDFKWAAVSTATNQVLIGHYTAKSGWVVDAAVARTIAAGDSTLSVTLRGTTVNVSLNGQQVLSRIYNSNVVDGGVGLFSRTGTTSFDSFTMKTDDPKFATATTQSATTSTSTTSSPTARILSASSVGPLTDSGYSATVPLATATREPTRSDAIVFARPQQSSAGAFESEVVRGSGWRFDAQAAATPSRSTLLRPATSPLISQATMAAPEPAAVAEVNQPKYAAAAAVIDWTMASSARTGAVAMQDRSAPWQLDFLNNVGRKQMNPNSRMRISL